jgi:hypothetical protein
LTEAVNGLFARGQPEDAQVRRFDANRSHRDRRQAGFHINSVRVSVYASDIHRRQ